jgi:phosphoglycolate phosphatase
LRERNLELLAVDLDGTLVDSAPDIAYCLDRALEAVGFEPPGEALARSWIGDGLEQLIARALADAGAADAQSASAEGAAGTRAAAMSAFLSCYRDNLFVRSTLYPGAVDALDVALEHGVRLCCITNKRESLSRALLEQAGVLERFELLVGGDSLPEKKPSPLPLLHATRTLGVELSACTLLGDSHQDLRAARAAGCGFIFAAYGYGKLDAAERAPFPELGALANLPTLLGLR